MKSVKAGRSYFLAIYSLVELVSSFANLNTCKEEISHVFILLLDAVGTHHGNCRHTDSAHKNELSDTIKHNSNLFLSVQVQ